MSFQQAMDVGDHPECDIVDRQLVVPSAQRPALLEPAHHAFDDVPLPIGPRVEVRVGRLVGPGRDDRADVVSAEPSPDWRVGIALVPGHPFGPAWAARVAGPAGAVLTGRYQRIRETVLLRTLGANRRQLLQIQLVEYAILGLLAALRAAAPEGCPAAAADRFTP